MQFNRERRGGIGIGHDFDVDTGFSLGGGGQGLVEGDGEPRTAVATTSVRFRPLDEGGQYVAGFGRSRAGGDA